MKQLQIVKTQPNPTTRTLMDALGQDKEVTRFNLYEDQDYARLVDLIFAHEDIISWW
jgi:hypothetical protein